MDAIVVHHDYYQSTWQYNSIVRQDVVTKNVFLKDRKEN